MKKIKSIKLIISAILLIFTVNSCENFLQVMPKQVVDEALLTDDVEGFVTAAYAYIGFHPSWESPFSPWWTGSMRSDDSYKGGFGVADAGDGWGYMETFVNLTSNGWPLDSPWTFMYFHIQRCNIAIWQMERVSEEEFPQKNVRIGEVKFLRAFLHFRLKQFFKYIPYMDETIEADTDYTTVPNRDSKYPDDMYLWEKILADFKDAESRLPDTQPQKGRVDKNAATAMVARTLMFMAYEQNENHQVKNINRERLAEALTYVNKLTDQEGGKLGLCDDFAYNFVPESDNNTKESIWELQFSINDGSSRGGKVNWGEGLNHPHGGWAGFQCCGFHHASYTMGNAFKTTPEGLPMFDDYNQRSYAEERDVYFTKYTFDPRFSHTIVVPGHPWKYNPELLFEERAIRGIADYGYFKSVKELPPPDCGCLLLTGWQFNSMNKRMIRYDEVLLWKAEILIQLDRHNEALEPINKVRQRAANSTARLVMADGSPIMNYKCEIYKPGVNCNWTKEFAWKAMEWENRLEMACEGRRFFDLQRWGTLEKTMNDYFQIEKNRFAWMSIARFTAGRDEFFPIPQTQINLVKGVYTQNVGY